MMSAKELEQAAAGSVFFFFFFSEYPVSMLIIVFPKFDPLTTTGMT